MNSFFSQFIISFVVALAVFSSPTVGQASKNITYSPNPAEVTIEIEVQEIAVLSVEDGTGHVTIDSFERGGFTVPTDPNELARISLSTNFCIGSIEVDFQRVTGLRGGDPNAWYGQAIGNANQNTLGVAPYMLTPLQAVFFGGIGNPFGLPGNPVAGGANEPLTTSGVSAGVCSPANGVFDISLGAITKWDLTLPSQPLFAAPDTYTIPLMVSIIP